MTHVLKFMPTALALVALRVLKPGGRLAIVAETYRGQTFGALMIIPMMLLRARYLTVEEHRSSSRRRASATSRFTPRRAKAGSASSVASPALSDARGHPARRSHEFRRRSGHRLAPRRRPGDPLAGHAGSDGRAGRCDRGRAGARRVGGMGSAPSRSAASRRPVGRWSRYAVLVVEHVHLAVPARHGSSIRRVPAHARRSLACAAT